MKTGRKALFVQYHHPGAYPPILNAVRILSQRGWDVRVRGIRQYDFPNPDLPAWPNVAWTLAPACKPGLLQKVHYAWVGLTALCTALLWRPHVAYISDPLAAPMGAAIAALARVTVIYHEHDAPAGRAASSLFLRWMLRCRAWLARRARACVIPNKDRERQFREEMGLDDASTLCVWNCPRKEEVPPAGRAAGRPDLDLYYHGVINDQRLPLSLLRALSLLPSHVRVVVVGNETAGSAGYMETFLALAGSLGVDKRVDWRGYVDRATLMREPVARGIGLAFMPMRSADPNLRHMVGASNKAFDYIALGMPILVSALPDWEEQFVKAGYAKSCDPADPASLASAVNWFLDNPSEAEAMAARGRERILAEWNYERQFEKVRALMEP